MKKLLLLTLLSCCLLPLAGAQPERPNVIFILSDDHRYDFMGFTGAVPGLQTPNMDRLAGEGAHLHNAFVGTALCSPSRASILTGQYSHVHEVVDNDAPAAEDLVYFPSYLQQAGYRTAFIGKWHMGHWNDDPRPGFDHWVSFRGQGTYYNPDLNVNGQRRLHGDSAYITDVLTDYATEWLGEQQDSPAPWFLYLSHKAVHAEFMPAPRHRGKYADIDIRYPPTMYPPDVEPAYYHSLTAPQPTQREKQRALQAGYRYDQVPRWVKEQRSSWHGVDYMYNGQMTFNEFYRNYLETLLGIDESIGRLLQTLEATGQLDNTIIFYMGDNGFSFGEHGLIDKRHAYEESMRVPLLAWAPGRIRVDSLPQIIMNVDIGPTILDIAGRETPARMNGRSFWPLLQGRETEDWREALFYEYYWERPFPQTPTTHAVRTDRYKFIRYHGIWDLNEFYDLEKDPYEARNLIADPAWEPIIRELNNRLFDWLEETDGMRIPLKATRNIRGGQDYKYGHTY